ncbi:MAG: UvrD-helicase domain-containing protein [Verrucomicrobia bacterium]|nr:UvrD-helicase domain-containing protein [Verrucomicrobiota bacterium]
MSAFDVLSRDLSVFSPYFLEASAGTGKTFAIEHLVTRLLIEGENPLLLEQVLVVTFTRAATRELKSRIRKNLYKTEIALKSKETTLDYLVALIERGEEAIAEALSRVERALICFDRAQIFTLHSFCHKALQEFAWEARVPFSLQDPDEKSHLPLLEEGVKEVLRTGLTSFSPGQIRLLLKKLPFEKWVPRLVSAVQDRKKIASFPPFSECFHAFQNALASLGKIEGFEEAVRAQMPLFKQMTGPEIPSQIALLDKILEKKSATTEEFDQLLLNDLFLEKMEKGNLKARAEMPTSSLIPSVQRALLPSICAAKDPRKIFLQLAKTCIEKCNPLLESAQALPPDALVEKMGEAIHSPDFVKALRQKYHAAIIDEFQDTDPLQWKIFHTLFHGHVRAFCLVGDPKQSIYAFRSADVYTYLSARAALGEGARRYLDTNYRSTPALVAALNRLFSLAPKGWMPLPARNEGLDVPAVKAKSVGVEQAGAVQFFIAETKKGRSRVWPPYSIEEEKLFPFIAKEILHAKEARKIDWDAFAILVKDRYQAMRLVDFFKRYQMPAAFHRGGSLLETRAYPALKELIAAVLKPRRRGYLRCALGGPLFGRSEADLQGDLLPELAQFEIWHALLMEKGFSAFFHSFLHSDWKKERSLYLDLRRLAELIIEEGVLSGQVLTFLEELPFLDENRLKIPPQEEKGSIVIMTMHMSKGLEFDTVFALGLASRHEVGDEALVRDGQTLLRTVYDPEDLASQQMVQERDAEKLRQLYVSLTRAKERVYIPLVLDLEEKLIERGTGAPIELFLSTLCKHLNLDEVQKALPGFTCQLIPQIALEPIPPRETPPLSARPSLHLPDQGTLCSFSSLATKQTPQTHTTPPADLILPLGAETGQMLHLLFEKIFQSSFHHPLNPTAIRHLLADQADLLYPWFEELLTTPLFPGGFPLTAVPGNQVLTEMQFYYPFAKGLMKGFADLFFSYEGKYYLLDWKSNYLENYSVEKIEEAMRAHDYFLQAEIYAEALARYVKLFDNRPFDTCFGGAIYYFIRGNAPYHFRRYSGTL